MGRAFFRVSQSREPGASETHFEFPTLTDKIPFIKAKNPPIPHKL